LYWVIRGIYQKVEKKHFGFICFGLSILDKMKKLDYLCKKIRLWQA